MIPRSLEGSRYEEERVERLRREMRNDVREEGKYQVFCTTAGRKPDVQGGDQG